MQSNILDNLEAIVIRTISTKEANMDPISLVPSTFWKRANIMMKKTAAILAALYANYYAIEFIDSE
jgi:hypothetical protein